MEITKTDRKWIKRLFERKPNATCGDVLKLIDRLARTDMRYNVDWLIESEINHIITEGEENKI